MEAKEVTPYIVVAHFQNPAPHHPKNESEEDMVEKFGKIGFKPYQIRIMFERFKVGKLILELEDALFSSQMRHAASPYDKLMQFFSSHRVDFKNDVVTHKAKGVKNLQKYVAYLRKKDIVWTYLNIYNGDDKVKIGRLYADEPIPKRMIE